MMKKTIAILLALVMVLGLFVACQKKTTEQPQTETKTETKTEPAKTEPAKTEPAKTETVDQVPPPTYTYNTYSTSLGNNWNPHAWETSAESSMLGYLTTPLVYIQAKDTEEGVYQWVFDMATEINDVTASHKEDLTKYKVTLPEGKTAEEVEDGYVFEIKLNPKACWEDGTPINADTYMYSLKAMLDPAMKNYRANNYYSGESAIAGASDYYFAGSTAQLENAINANYKIADLVKGEDGQYRSPNGEPVFWAVNFVLTNWLQGNTLKQYVEAYGDQYFAVDTWDALVALMDDNGLVPYTDESYELFAPVTTGNPAWGETADDLYAYLVYEKTFPEATIDSVGCYKVDDYTIIYVNSTWIDYYDFLYHSSDWPWIVYEDLYEKGKDTTGTLVTTNYGTTVETTKSYGPYKLTYLQPDKQLVFELNENWWGFEKQADGSYISMTPYEVDGKKVQRYQTTKIVINVMDDDAAKQAFLKGELDEWAPSAEELVTYAASDRLYKADETYTMSFFFHTNADDLKVMDESKGNTNSVVLSNTNFRRAFSYAIDRAEWVTSTPGFTPSFGILNNLYYYDFFYNPASVYRNSDAAMQAICDLYDVKYGEGTPYATLRDAYKSINGYNLTTAKELMAQACKELVEAGLYKEGEEIKIRIGYKKGALDSSDQKQVELMNKYLNAAIEGSGFGKITLEAVGNINDRYGDTAKGEFAIGYGAWGGAALSPFTMFRVYCDDDYVDPIHEAGCWDPATENLTMNINGEDVTMTWKAWSNSMSGTGVYAKADPEVKLAVLSGMEKNYLQKYYRIPLATSTVCTLLAFKLDNYTPDYNFAYGWGGFELMQYNYNDAEWAEFLASQSGALNYE